MRMKASVYKQYGDAAIMNIVLDSLPKVMTIININHTIVPLISLSLPRQIAAEVAAPLAKTEEIVLIGGNDSTTADITRLVGQIPPAVSALTGVDLSKVLGKVPGAKVAN
jgi:flotillin